MLPLFACAMADQFWILFLSLKKKSKQQLLPPSAAISLSSVAVHLEVRLWGFSSVFVGMLTGVVFAQRSCAGSHIAESLWNSILVHPEDTTTQQSSWSSGSYGPSAPHSMMFPDP